MLCFFLKNYPIRHLSYKTCHPWTWFKGQKSHKRKVAFGWGFNLNDQSLPLGQQKLGSYFHQHPNSLHTLSLCTLFCQIQESRNCKTHPDFRDIWALRKHALESMEYCNIPSKYLQIEVMLPLHISEEQAPALRHKGNVPMCGDVIPPFKTQDPKKGSLFVR